ncbi:MAG: Ig-like domain-containing protein, partial [Oribacterium sp.]|nr:Ig-like domain-containing protein [Oribacterium sp.]
SEKTILKVSKKGIITPKKRGEADVECQQKVKGGSWQPLSTKIHLYVQMPEMAKKTDANMGDKGLNAYSFLSKTTYSPTSWKSTNPKVAKVDEAGNITVLKPGRTNIIAEYGEGKTGSKKKYRTKLRIR